MNNKKKIAIINQRYGNEVNGGSEYYTKCIAEKLNKDYDITILTTTALDYMSWDNYYAPGNDNINGVKILRFPVAHSRNRILCGLIRRIIMYKIPVLFNIASKFWPIVQGPYSPDFVEYIRNHRNLYDKFIFVTYLYYLTIEGIKEVYDKSILIPTAHDEPMIKFHTYRNMFKNVAAILYLTEEEKKFVNKTFYNENIINDVVGSGIDIPKIINSLDFKEKYSVTTQYLIYVGRIDKGKNCEEMLNYFIKYKDENYVDTPQDLKLILLGKVQIDIPKRKDILSLGFVDENDKYNGISGAKVLLLPSQYESLSLSVLEAFALGIPALVNGKCDVLRGHCIKSNAGFTYIDYDEFKEKLSLYFNNDSLYNKMKLNGIKYVKENYNWDTVISKYKRMIE